MNAIHPDFTDVFDSEGDCVGYVRPRSIGGWIARGRVSVVLPTKQEAIDWVKANPFWESPDMEGVA